MLEFLVIASAAYIIIMLLWTLSSRSGLEEKIKPQERSKIIIKIADEIRKKSKVFVKCMTLETGKTLAEGEAEVTATTDIFEKRTSRIK